jgi:anti-sigma-K factor RskA
VDIQEYISSGIIESYVLGLTSSDERREFEKLCTQYPQLVTARTDFELLLEKKMLDSSPLPDAAVKEKVMKAIRQYPHVNQTKVISMEQTQTNRNSSSMKWVAAASVILLLAAGYFAYDYYSKNKDLEKELADSKASMTKMEENQKIMSDPNIAVVNLKGTDKAPKSAASIYWDSTAANVYMVVKNMPKLASDKQYQLWSIIDGKEAGLQPTSLGLFDVGEDGKIILKMSGSKKADMFAITIENKGNSGGPNLEQLQVIGKTSL